MYDLVRNPEDRVCHVAAHIVAHVPNVRLAAPTHRLTIPAYYQAAVYSDTNLKLYLSQYCQMECNIYTGQKMKHIT